MTAPERSSRFRGLVLGAAVGDALGLPFEGLSAARAKRLFPGPLRHRLVFGHGMTSDDTEHLFLTGQALLAGAGDVPRFERSLSWRLRGWLAALPAGIGFATLRATIKLWIGLILPIRSGVRSAGNGATMRSAVIGAFSAGDPAKRRALCDASSLLTHTDGRAVVAARAVAEIAALEVREGNGARPAANEVVELLRALPDEPLPEWDRVLDGFLAAAAAEEPVESFAVRLEQRGFVTGYALHSVPVALYAWWRHHGDYAETLRSVIALGGDTDTTGAFAGALAGATCGAEGIPVSWIDGLWEWPRGRDALEELAARLSTVPAGGRARDTGGRARDTGGRARDTGGPVRIFLPGVLLRNAVFLTIVLAHGLRRAFPPYGTGQLPQNRTT